MDKIKVIEELAINNWSDIISIPKYYNSSSTINASEEPTLFFNNKLVEFLTECGVENVKYKDNCIWIFGIPINFYFTYNASTSYNGYLNCVVSSLLSIWIGTSKTNTPFIINGSTARFRFRLLGNEKQGFYLVVMKYPESSTLSESFGFGIFKGVNVINNHNIVIIGGANNNSYTSISNRGQFQVFEFNDDGTFQVKNTLLNKDNTYGENLNLRTSPSDFNQSSNNFPLIEWMPAIYKITNCYCYPTNSKMPVGVPVGAEGQTFIKMGDNVYYKEATGPYIKCNN